MLAKYSRPIALVAAAVLGWLSLQLSDSGFTKLQQFQQLKRTPVIPITGVLHGENLLQGEVVAATKLLSTPYSGKDSVYYLYIKKHRCKKDKRDSWCEVERRTNSTPFYLRDSTGSIKIVPNSMVGWQAPRVIHKKTGEYLHSEWRLEPGQKVTVLGYAEKQGDVYQVSFSGKHQLFPTISTEPVQQLFEKSTSKALLYCWGGVALAAAATFALMVGLQFHRLIGFVSLLTLVISGQLLFGSISTAKLSANNAKSQIQSVTRDTEYFLKRQFQQQGVQWNGWQQIDSFHTVLSKLSESDKNRVERKLQNLHARLNHLQQEHRLFPGYSLFDPADLHSGSLMATLTKLAPLAQGDKTIIAHKKTPKSKWIVLIIATVIALVTSVTGLVKIRVKRLMENVPTSKISGVMMGLCEVKGALKADSSALTTPISNQPSVWYRHQIFERSSDRKGHEWKNLSDETQQCAFHIVDDTSSIRVNPEGAEVITGHTKTHNEGLLRHKVDWLQESDLCYLIGDCTLTSDLNKEHSLSLQIAKTKDASPFIISNKDESKLLFSMAFSGMLLLTIGLSLWLGSMLLWFDLTTEVTLTHLFVLGIIPPILLLIITVVLHYNDIIFLKQRVNRNRANIEVALQKRFDNINTLIPVVEKYLDHETKLLKDLTQLRNENQNSLDNPTHLPQYLNQEQQFLIQFRATLENYPQLQGNQVIQAFNQRLISLETELAFIKEAYNNSVEVFNARIQSVPDNMLNLVLKYQAEPFLRL